ncbi:hypothetical protein EVAR_78422_1 [Eumeta japonica]|uniref:Uncharacterized protein n=1 Tax=Eumeta variegata TaxID=151549 RepID=A0A4C1TYQ5_EUMVA|nr:hypothetical protein EVAR_78422_1 [Eumeta japonica]
MTSRSTLIDACEGRVDHVNRISPWVAGGASSNSDECSFKCPSLDLAANSAECLCVFKTSKTLVGMEILFLSIGNTEEQYYRLYRYRLYRN